MDEWLDAVQIRVPDRIGVTHSRTNFLDMISDLTESGLMYETCYEANNDGTDNGGWMSYWLGPDELAVMIYSPLDGA